MKYRAIISAHIYIDDEGYKDVEILSQVDDEEGYTGIFDDMTNALLDEIDIGDSEDYYFIAIVEGEFVESQHSEGVEYDIEYDVKEIKSLLDLKKTFRTKDI